MTRIIDQEHQRVGRWMHQHGAGQWRDGATCIGLERDGQLVAGTMYDWFNGASIYANIAIAGPVTREFLWFISYYPFMQLGAKVVLALIAENNQRSKDFVEQFGFSLLTVIPEADSSGSLLLYAIYADQCKWLHIRRHHGQALTATPA